MSQQTLHAWFSAKAELAHGSSVYSTPDGGEITCTVVSANKDFDYGWDDSQYVGEVIKWLRVASKPPHKT